MTKVHCVGAVDVDTGQRFVWGPGEIPQALETLHKNGAMLIGHNIMRYDLPVLYKLHRFVPYSDTEIRDTLVMARVTFPNVRETDGDLVASGRLPKQGSDGKPLLGKHSLEAWGYRLGERKAHFEGPWAEWTQTMQDYMVQDVTTNYALFRHLEKQKVSESALDLEHRMAKLCDIIEVNGCPFDVEAAAALQADLAGKKAAAEEKLKQQFGFWLAPDKPSQLVFTPKVNNAARGYVKGQALCKLKRVDFNPGSRDHIIRVLTKRRWKPSEFTDAGKAQINEVVVAGLLGQYPELDGLADYLTIDKRLQQLHAGDQAWLRHVDPKGYIHGVVNPMGTITSRASHFNPNLGQVPSAKKPYGTECRRLFRVLKPFVMLGADQEGLELRGFAHYLAKHDGGAYAKVVLEGDPHWVNAQAMGLVGRKEVRDKHNPLHTVIRESGSKRTIYAVIYGSGMEKTGRIIYGCLSDAARTCGDDGRALFREWFGNGDPTPAKLKKVGGKVRNNLINGIDGFAEFKKRVAFQVTKYGWVPGLDKRRVPVRSEHSAVNFMIQSCGAIICKRWGCDAFDELSATFDIGWQGQVVPILWVHDEYQFAVKEGYEQEVGEIVVKHARAAGEPYGFRVPLDSKYSVGQSWADTH